MAARFFKVIMIDNQDLQRAKTQIIQATSNTMIETGHIDFGSFESIRRCASEIRNKEKYLHILINNVGIFQSKSHKTEDHLDPVMQINHFGPFLLTSLLIDILKESSPGRIIFITSSGAFLHNLDEKELPVIKPKQCENILSLLTKYYSSKLCNMIISKECSNRFQKYNISSNCVHPGMTNTQFLLKNGDYKSCITPVLTGILKLATQNKKQSADVITFMATSRILENTSGKYFVNYQEFIQPKIVNNNEYRHKVWKQAENTVYDKTI
ncbi:hypothetical protein GWI33_000703 [Rhynchophorus ferrugineus]|uniref:Uncharacterized protein n=1 Tax=Rhynchophorus ferrugineus TaxID=354439 RepID=A0A834HSY0_RHYFE|nr:hypothetical protein GWI33_000703 [Rhynchophorus ferrugineus]